MSQNSMDVLGYWWLPAHPDHKVPGRLTWDVEEGGRLELLGELHPLHLKDNVLPDGEIQPYRTPRTKLENQFPVIHGERGRQAYTLLNSFSLNGVGLHDLEEQPENVAVNGVLHGAWYTDLEDIEADRAIFDIRHLTSWVDTSGLVTDFPIFRGVRDGPYVNITANRLPAFTTSIGTADVKLRQSLEFVGDQESASGVHNTWDLVVEMQPMGRLEVFTDIATDVRALVAIATGRSADIEKAVLQHPELHDHTLAGRSIPEAREDITYYIRWSHPGAENSPVRTGDLFCSLDQLGGADGLGRWLETARNYRTEIRRVMATRYTGAMYLEDRIANVCAALESFDVVRRDKPKGTARARERLTASISYAATPFSNLIVEPSHNWATRVLDARNNLAHHGTQFRTQGRIGEHLLAEQLYWLFVHCILRVAGAPETAFEAIAKHREIQWLIERATNQHE